MKRISKLIILFFLLGSFSGCFSLQPPNKRIEIVQQPLPQTNTISETVDKTKGSVQYKKTLISNRVRCISADSDNVWIATDQGVSRYIRKTDSWVSYTRADGLVDDAVNALAVDGNLVWFATNEGVSQYNVQTNKWRIFKKQDGLASERVSSIAVDGNYVWFGTESGLNRYDKTIDSWAVRSKKDGLISNNIKTIAVESEYVWVGTIADKQSRDDFRFMDIREKKPSAGGVSRYQRSTDSWNNYSKADGLIGEEITTIAVGEDTVWFGTYNSGVSSYSKTDQTFIGTYTKTDLLVSNKIRSIVVDGNSVWFGTANGGVQRYIKSVNTWVRYTREDGLADDHVTWIHVSGNEVWFGTYQSGVSKFDKNSGKWTIYAKADQLADNDVRVIDVDESGQLWIGTAEGLSKYNPTNGEWSNYDKKNGLVSNYISAIAVGSPQIWIGTDRGLGEMLADNKWKFYDENDGLKAESVTCISSQQELLWLGTSRGIYRFDKTTRKLENLSDLSAVPGQAGKDGLPGTLITAIASNDRYVWAGAKNGLWRYEPKTKEVMVYNVKDGLGHDSINAILISEFNHKTESETYPPITNHQSPITNHQIWVGTEGGLSRYDSQKNNWTTLTVKDGLPNDNVRALYLDKENGHLWIGTPTGLAKFDLNSNELNRFEKTSNYDIKDLALNRQPPAPVAEFAKNSGKGDGNSLWLCTTAGLVEYNLLEDKLQEYQAQVSVKPLLEMGISNIEFDGDYIWFSNWEDSVNGCIIRFNRNTETWQRFTRADILGDTKAESMTQIRYIQVDGDYVWFATDLGVLRYHKISDTWRHYTTADGLDSNDLRNISISKRNVWVSETGGGNVNRFDKQTEKWSVIELNCKYPFDRVSSIAIDDEDVWFSMRSNVYKFNERTGEMRAYTTKDGLVRDGSEWISVDEKYVWVAIGGWGGTNKGLSRYDKAKGKWEAFSTTDVLMDDDIRKIIVTDNDVWIVYDSWRDAGVTRYDRESDEWTNIKPQGDWGSAVTEISEDGDYVWLATEANGLKRYHLTSGTWTSFDEKSGLLQNHINDRGLAVDEKYVWAGTPRGLNRYNKRTESWTYFTKMDTLIGREVKALAVDDRYVWCGTDEGLSRYDKWYGAWENFKKKGGRQTMRTSSGSWSWWEPEVAESLADNNVSAIAVDEQYVWIGTRNGANRYDKIADRWDKYTPENGLPHPDVTSVAIAGSNVWMGTNSGIGKYPRTADDPNAWISYTSGTEIQAMAVSKEFAQTLISDEVWCMSASKNAVWVGTRRGVSRYDISKDIWKTFTEEDGLASNEVSSIAIDGDKVWFGGDKGVTLYSESTHDWIHFTTEDGLPSNRITCIAVPSSGGVGVGSEDVWFGTFDAGVTRYSKTTKTWKTLTKEDGLSHNGILSIAADGDNVWVGTQRGLSRYNKHTDTWTVYTEHHGSEDI
jgi:ligand-binding sensor domain-containing protein